MLYSLLLPLKTTNFENIKLSIIPAAMPQAWATNLYGKMKFIIINFMTTIFTRSPVMEAPINKNHFLIENFDVPVVFTNDHL